MTSLLAHPVDFMYVHPWISIAILWTVCGVLMFAIRVFAAQSRAKLAIAMALLTPDCSMLPAPSVPSRSLTPDYAPMPATPRMPYAVDEFPLWLYAEAFDLWEQDIRRSQCGHCNQQTNGRPCQNPWCVALNRVDHDMERACDDV